MKAFRGAMYAILFSALIVLFMIAGIILAGKAFALPDDEVYYYGNDSAYAACTVLDEMVTGNLRNDAGVVIGVTQGIANEYGLTMVDAVEVINYAVYYYCDQHWPLLVTIGKIARSNANEMPSSEIPTRPTTPAGPIGGGINGHMGGRVN